MDTNNATRTQAHRHTNARARNQIQTKLINYLGVCVRELSFHFISPIKIASAANI